MPTDSNTSRRFSAAFSGIFELRADTASGVPGPMSAPVACTSSRSYRAAIRKRFSSDPAARQQMAVMARRLRGAQHHGPLPVSGPFAGEACEILAAIQEQRR